MLLQRGNGLIETILQRYIDVGLIQYLTVSTGVFGALLTSSRFWPDLLKRFAEGVYG